MKLKHAPVFHLKSFSQWPSLACFFHKNTVLASVQLELSLTPERFHPFFLSTYLMIISTITMANSI